MTAAVEEVPTSTIVRRLARKMREIDALYQEMEKLRELIPVPTPEEFEEMVRGDRPLTLRVLLLGVLGESLFHLEEAATTIDHYKPFTEKALGTGMQRHWQEDLGDRIRREVEWREEAKSSLTKKVS